MNAIRFTPTRWLWFAIWGALAAYGALTVWLGLLGLAYPYQADYGEGIVLWFAREIAHGHSIYKGIAGYPYASSNYPPLTMLLTALLFPIFGEGYTAGRLLNFAAALIVAALIFRIAQYESRNAHAGALAALFFLGSPYVYHWVPLLRADLLGLGFAFAGIYFVWKYSCHASPRSEAERGSPVISRQKRYLLFAICLFLLSLYTKHTLIAAPAAAFLVLASGNKREAILFALTLGVVGGAIYLAINFQTRGGFTFGLIDSNATVFLPSQLFSYLGTFAMVHAILLGLGIWGWVSRVRAGRFSVLEAYAVTAVATLVFVGRIGAWENYFFEAIAVACIFACVKLKAQSEKRKYQLPITLALVLQLFLYTREHDPRIALNLIAQEYPANQQLAALLARTNGVIISEDMGALVTSGKEVGYYTFQYSSLARAGKWDQSWELNGLRDGLFPLVILQTGVREDVDYDRRFTREFVSALDRYYAQTQKIGKYEIYTPAPPLNLQSVNFGNAITLVGWSANPETLQPGTWNLTIVWQALRALPRRYTAFVHLENEKDEKVTQEDKEPRGGIYPTTRWAAGEMVREVYMLDVPSGLAPGKYILRVGWYDAETGERLEVRGSTDNSLVLTTLDYRK